jgi:PAS domain S-box-containing protein
MLKSVKNSIESQNSLSVQQKKLELSHQLFDLAPVPMWAYDKTTHVVICANQFAIDHYGYGKEGFYGLHLKDFIYKEDHAKLKEYSLINQPVSGEWRLMRKDGSVVFANIHVRETEIDNSQAILAVAYDITESKALEKHMYEQKELLEKVLFAIPHSVFWKDRNSRFLGCNKNFLNNAGLTSLDQLVGKSDYDMPWTKEESDYYIKCDQEVMESEIPLLNHEEKHTVENEHETTVLTSKVPIRNNDGEVMGILGVFIDITDRKKIEERLLIQEKAIEAVGVGITITNPHLEGNPIVFANPKFLEISGYAREEVMGKSSDFLTGPETSKETIKAIKSAFKNKKSYVGEILSYRKNGEPFWNYITINPIFDAHGNLINFVKFQQDITDKKKADVEILKRTQELNTFMYRASHDFRGPIASLFGLIELAKRELNSENKLEYLKMFEETSSKLDDILKNLLDLTGIKQSDPVIEELVFHDLIKEVTKSLIEKGNYINLNFIFNYEAKVKLQTDKLILRLILNHLIDNAIKYHEDKGSERRVEIAFMEFSFQNQIIITDNGIGIDKNALHKVFDMFYRGTELSKGNGLGLYTVKSCVEKLGGSIEIFSKEKKGTEVIVRLPRTYSGEE